MRLLICILSVGASLVSSQQPLQFAGYTWAVKSEFSGPGPNHFDETLASVDSDSGDLTLSVREGASFWGCAEVILNRSLGYGTYRFFLRADSIQGLDKNLVLGLFTYASDTQEVDIELSQWGGAYPGVNADFAVQPSAVKRFLVSGGGGVLEAYYTWGPGFVNFSCGGTTWSHTGSDIPSPGSERVHMNLWLFRGQPPASGRGATVRVANFSFVPLRSGSSGDSGGSAPTYTVSVLARDAIASGSSLISRENGTSAFNYSFTTGWFPAPAGSPYPDGLVVRVVECNPDHHSCEGVEHPEWTNAGALAVVGAALAGATPSAEFVSPANVSWLGVDAPPHGGAKGLWGFADPRMAVRASTGEYFLTFDNCTANCYPKRTGMLATSLDPFNASAWTFRGPLLGSHAPYSGGTALLLRDAPPHYAFVGNSNTANVINLATSEDGYAWVLNASKVPWMAGRPGMWDASGVAAGAQPERLSTGDYLFIYNIDTGFPYKPSPLGRCSVGWAILSGQDPTRIIARAAEPLLVPVLPWETCGGEAGKGPYPKCQEPLVVFSTGMKPLGGDNFLILYGAADSVVGVAKVAVKTA